MDKKKFKQGQLKQFPIVAQSSFDERLPIVKLILKPLKNAQKITLYKSVYGYLQRNI